MAETTISLDDYVEMSRSAVVVEMHLDDPEIESMIVFVDGKAVLIINSKNTEK